MKNLTVEQDKASRNGNAKRQASEHKECSNCFKIFRLHGKFAFINRDKSKMRIRVPDVFLEILKRMYVRAFCDENLLPVLVRDVDLTYCYDRDSITARTIYDSKISFPD
ncbi:hypothetical protein BWQ96_05331 [Gracilariopsis chorda]|uniref:Uncharacterized protein n=1 Tax=Gracilariopsis chorda TaxID=448386 RepID=A0A2V3IS19_9FLOR|nr:hypothetical protein BWQ96_05331 [Gracilariopsis chorda]|eukprot:PXF44911.1 hypothetical protein BWQ96_05331 [Gracilariopsis chorda]